jgi:hypothetical protein
MSWASALLNEISNLLNPQTLKPSLQLLAIFLAIISLGTGVTVAYASGDTLPGDTLYPIKTAVENVQLLLTFDEASAARLQIEFAQRRIGEMKALAEIRQFDDIQIAADNYQSLLIGTNESLRAMVLEGDPRTNEIGNLVEEALFYDVLILSGIMDIIPADSKSQIEIAIGATKSGNAIARQWVELSASTISGGSAQPPETTRATEDFGIPLPTDITCWPSDLVADPPEGIPICEEEQTPVPIPENLTLFCWPTRIPFNPPEGIPLCKEGQAPIPLPEDLVLNCWPREIPYDPPEGLPICVPGQLPVPLPKKDIACWPSDIPYDAPEGIPLCDSGSYPTPNPEELPCWPPELSTKPPPGMPLCEPGELPTSPRDIRDRDRRPGGGGVNLEGLISQMETEFCWPAWMEEEPPLDMSICQPN